MAGAELRRTKAATATTSTTSTSSPLSKTRISTSSLNSELSSNSSGNSSNSSKCGSVVCRRHGLGSNDSSNDRAAISDDNDETTTASSTSTSPSMMIAPLIDRDVENYPNDDYSDDDDDDAVDDGEFVKHCRRKLLTWRLTLSSLSPSSPPSSLSLDDHFVFRKTQRKSRRRALLCASILLLLLFLYALRLLFLKGRPLLMERPAFLYGGKTLASSQVQACMLPKDHVFPEDFVRPHAPTWEWYVWEDMMIANATVAPRTEPPPPKTPVLQEEESQQVQRPRLLIAQYSGYGDYSRMLDLTLPVHLAYAKQWHADVLVVQGTTLDLSAHGVNETCNKPGPRATFNKLAILERALQLQHRYDFLLILDTDAMIVDFDTDFTTQLLPLTHALAAHRVYAFDKVDTWDINAGVTLWNLHHPQTKPLSDAWTEMTLRHIPQVLMSNDDQFFLQRVLLLRRKQRRKRRSTSIVYSLTKAFAYSDGTIIKHFKRQARSWKDTGIDGRLHQIQQAIPPTTATTTLMMKPTITYADRKAPGI